MANKLLGQAMSLWTRMLPLTSDGPRGLQYSFQLDTLTTDVLTTQLTSNGLKFVNGIFVDNSNNASGFTLYNPITLQKIFVPANSQASLALITVAGTDTITLIGSSTGGVQVPVILRNTEPSSDTIWSTIAAGSIIGAVTVQGQVTALPYDSVGIDTATPSITAGGVAQSLFAANPARKGLLISNPASAAGQNIGAGPPESLFIKFGANPAIGSGNVIEIVPGGYFNPQGAMDTRSIAILAATTGHVFQATYWQ